MRLLAVVAGTACVLLMGGVAHAGPPEVLGHTHDGSDGQQECLHEQLAASLNGDNAYVVTVNDEGVTIYIRNTELDDRFDADDIELMIELCEAHSRVRDDGSGPSSSDHPDHETDGGVPTHPRAGQGISDLADDIDDLNSGQRVILENATIVYQGRGQGYHVVHRSRAIHGHGRTTDPDSPDGIIARTVACRINPFYCR